MGDAHRTSLAILEAAERVIVQSGVDKATIDEVAREAGVSKGGVLHHFPSKEAILIALLARLIEIFDADLLAKQAEDPDVRGAFTRAFLNVVNTRTTSCIEVSFALKASFRRCPALQDLAHGAHARWQARVENDGIDPVVASIVRLATDGLWLARVNHVAVPSEPLHSSVIDYLVGLTRTTPVRLQAASLPAN